MKHCESLLMLVCITLLPGSEASAVTGHLGGDVTLSCQTGDPKIHITQVQWDYIGPEGSHSYRIVVFNPDYGVNISKSPLWDRVETNEHSLMIKKVQMTDAGTYTCRVAAFPTGIFNKTLNLIVRAQSFPPSSAVIYATAAVLLLLGFLAAIACFTLLRGGSSVRCHAINTSSVAVDASRREDVVYSQVNVKTSRGSTVPSSHQHTRTVSEDVTYAGLVF